MQNLALLFTGYSFFYALVLSITHFRCENYQGHRLAQLMGLLSIVALVVLQLSHFFYLLDSLKSPRVANIVHSPYYIATLFLVAPAFYLFSKPLLMATNHFSFLHALHFLPLIFAFILPYEKALLLAFIIGGLYLLWLAKVIYALRKQRAHFRIELLILGIIFSIAVVVLIFGLAFPLVSEPLFFSLYASAIGFAFLLINITLIFTPQISNTIAEAARETYAVSTLKNIDCDNRLEALNALMKEKKLYQESNLDLYTLATELDLSTHQLSELMNTRLGKSFSRYLREQRITAAKTMLQDKPSASVLSVGLHVGFTSQSNFYEAFKEIEGTTPGKFRKLSS